jgi:hypothetical protein
MLENSNMGKDKQAQPDTGGPPTPQPTDTPITEEGGENQNGTQ